MNRESSDNRLDLGPDVIELLLPHRAPLLLVGRVDAFRPGESPSIEACHHVSANEDVFRGHFPGFHIWPGVYTQEGLGQASQLLGVLHGLYQGWADAGEDPADCPRGDLSCDSEDRERKSQQDGDKPDRQPDAMELVDRNARLVKQRDVLAGRVGLRHQ